MEILKCIYNNQISDFIVKRTCITIKNHTFEKTLGFFDIRYYIYDNKLFIEDNYNTNLIISGNNAKLLYKTIKKKNE